jgi:hypothetical protein
MADRKQKINPKVFFTGPPENASYKKKGWFLLRTNPE